MELRHYKVICGKGYDCRYIRGQNCAILRDCCYNGTYIADCINLSRLIIKHNRQRKGSLQLQHCLANCRIGISFIKMLQHCCYHFAVSFRC